MMGRVFCRHRNLVLTGIYDDPARTSFYREKIERVYVWNGHFIENNCL